MSRLDRIKEQHPDLNISVIDILALIDPTDTYKYTEFLIKRLKQWYDNKDIQLNVGVDLIGAENVEMLNEFEIHCKAKRIRKSDIGQYDGFQEIKEQVKMAEELVKQKELEKQTLKIHEDDTWLVLTPLSFEASKIYGAGTKWCVTQEKYWNDYLDTHRLIYVLNRKTGIKIAFSRKFSNNAFQAWSPEDLEFSPFYFDFIPDEIFLKIRKELQMEKTTGELIGSKKTKSPEQNYIKKISDLIRGGSISMNDYLEIVNGTNYGV